MRLPRFRFPWHKTRKEGLRQGDVMFYRVQKLPEGVEEVGSVLRIEGEGSGHFHEVKGVQVFQRPRVAVAERPQIDWTWLRVPEEGASMVHDTRTDTKERPHPVLHLPPGLYRLEQTREHQNPRPVD